MRNATLPVAEVGLIAATRGIGGAGIALLLADRIPAKNRKAIGWGLFAVGALTTIPLILDVIHNRSMKPRHDKGEQLLPPHRNSAPQTTHRGPHRPATIR